MPAPTQLTNLEKVFNSIKSVLEGVDNAHGYRTNGLVIDMGNYPTAAPTDYAELWRQRHAGVGIVSASESVDPGRTGGVRRYRHSYALSCIVELTTEQRTAGKTILSLVLDMVDDIKVALQAGAKIQAAAVVLGYPNKVNDGLPLSLVDHRIDGMGNMAYEGPACYFDLFGSFSYDVSL